MIFGFAFSRVGPKTGQPFAEISNPVGIRTTCPVTPTSNQKNLTTKHAKDTKSEVKTHSLLPLLPSVKTGSAGSHAKMKEKVIGNDQKP